MTNVSAVEKMAELMQQMEENSPRVAALQYCLSEVAKRITELEQKLAESQREFCAADATIENLEAKCAALAAELSAFERICNEAVFITDEHYEQCPPEVRKMIRSLVVLKIPSYQAFLDEVRAQGVEMFAAWNDKHIKKGVEHKESLTAVSHAARGLAEQIRKGVQS